MKIRRFGKGLTTEVDSTINDGYEQKLMLEELGMTVQEANKAATKMQATVRGYFARKEYKDIIQKKIKKKVSHLDVSNKTNEILKRHKLTLAQANVACTKIQALYRGWTVRKIKLRHIPSHESWRHDWLWKEFQMSPEEVQAAVTHKEKQHHKEEELIFQPRRLIEIDHIKFMKAFKGELADYNDKTTETSSSSDLSDEDVTDDILSKKSSEVMSGEAEETKKHKIAEKKHGIESSHSSSAMKEFHGEYDKDEEEEESSTEHSKEIVSEEQLQRVFDHFTEEESYPEHGQENVSEEQVHVKLDTITEEESYSERDQENVLEEHLHVKLDDTIIEDQFADPYQEIIDSVEHPEKSIGSEEQLISEFEIANIDEITDNLQTDEGQLRQIMENEDDEVQPEEVPNEEQESSF